VKPVLFAICGALEQGGHILAEGKAQKKAEEKIVVEKEGERNLATAVGYA